MITFTSLQASVSLHHVHNDILILPSKPKAIHKGIRLDSLGNRDTATCLYLLCGKNNSVICTLQPAHTYTC